jgi:hypothetical protein
MALVLPSAMDIAGSNARSDADGGAAAAAEAATAAEAEAEASPSPSRASSATALHPAIPQHLTVRSFVVQWGSGPTHLREFLTDAANNPQRLLSIAQQTAQLQEFVASGCLMIQGVTLVRLWTLLAKQQPTAHNEHMIVAWGPLPLHTLPANRATHETTNVRLV